MSIFYLQNSIVLLIVMNSDTGGNGLHKASGALCSVSSAEHE